MKKFLTFVAGFILVCIALASIGPIILLGVGAALAYYSFQSFIKSPSLAGKLWWGIVGIFGLSMLFQHMPAIIGIVAIGLLYYGWRQLKKGDAKPAPASEDYAYSEFSNFESEWEDIMNKHK